MQTTNCKDKNNHPTSFGSIAVGDKASISRRIDEADVLAFAALSGDFNPLHTDAAFAGRTTFQRPVAQGMLVASYVSTLVGMHLPGPGALWIEQSFRWREPVFIGDELHISLTVTQKSEGSRALIVHVETVNQRGAIVMDGVGIVTILEEQNARRGVPLSERVALVTGSSRGIGAAIALALSKAGVRVLVNYVRSSAQAEQLCDSITQRGGQAIAVCADVTHAELVTAMVAKAQQHFGKPVDILVNNASASLQARPFIETTWDQIQPQVDVQVRGAFNCCKAVIPSMIEQKWGCIVNIGSIYTWNTPPAHLTGYVLAKSALKSFTRSLATELGPRGIRVNLVSPGMTQTDLIAEVPERLRKVHAMQTPLRRLATTNDVAQVVLFLCSEGADFINGADIPVCGGISM